MARLLGPSPDFGEACALLGRLGFGVDQATDTATVTVPTYRRDITRPVDLVEEIARLWGFHRFADSVPQGSRGALTPVQAATRSLKEVLVGAGLSEAQTLSFIGQADLDALRLPEGDPRRVGIKVKNPLREEEGTMRTTLLPGLIVAVARNVGHGMDSVRLFETGRVFLTRPDPTDSRIPDQPLKLSFIEVGEGIDVYSGTATIALIANATGHPLSVIAAEPPALHPGRAGNVEAASGTIGFVGELHPSVARAAGLPGRVVVGEIDLLPLVTPLPDWKLDDVSVFPPHVFDLAFVLSDEVSAASLLASVTGAAEHLEDLVIFDEYRGDSVPDGHRSLAVRVTLRAMDRTLSDDDAGPIRAAIISEVSSDLRAELRGGQ